MALAVLTAKGVGQTLSCVSSSSSSFSSCSGSSASSISSSMSNIALAFAIAKCCRRQS